MIFHDRGNPVLRALYGRRMSFTDEFFKFVLVLFTACPAMPTTHSLLPSCITYFLQYQDH